MNLGKPWVPSFIVAVLLTVMGITSLLSLRVKSPTVDEFAHLPAGYYYWKTGDFSLYDKNPPFIRLLCALPLLKENITIDWSRPHNQGGSWRPWIFGTHFMQENKKTYDHLFFLGRIPVVLLALMLGFFVFRWARELYGPLGGLISLVFYTFSPNILSHARLVTTDLGFTCFMFIFLYYSWKSFFLGARRAWIPAGVFLGMALLSKFTGLLLFPLLVILYMITPSQAENPAAAEDGEHNYVVPVPRIRFMAFWPTAKRAIRPLVLIGLVAVVVVNLGYGFKGSFQCLRDVSPESRFLRSFDLPIINKIPLPFPSPYVRGFDSQKIDTEQGEFLNYLDGEFSNSGWWYYYIYAFFLKVPMAVLLGLAVSFWMTYRSRGKPKGLAFLVVPILTVLAVFSIFNELNIGIRYMLPTLPLLFVWMGNLAAINWRPRFDKAIVWGLLVAQVIASVAIFPDYLAFFNSIAGGPENGPRHLLDSNLDWGQDLKKLKYYLNERGISEVGLAYFGHVDPHIYGISYHPLGDEPQTGHMAVSANFLYGLPYVLTYTHPPRIVQPGTFRWLQDQKPVARIGHSIYVFSN